MGDGDRLEGQHRENPRQTKASCRHPSTPQREEEARDDQEGVTLVSNEHERRCKGNEQSETRRLGRAPLSRNETGEKPEEEQGEEDMQ